MALGASLVSTSTSRASAVSCELCHTSSACCSGESSSARAAWIPPWAFAELHDCSDPLDASATRAPARCAETAAARPEAPLPITSTSKGMGSATVGRLYQRRLNSRHFNGLCTVKRAGRDADHTRVIRAAGFVLAWLVLGLSGYTFYVKHFEL